MMLSRCLLLSSCAWLALPLQAAELLLYTEENPPLNYSQAGQPAGFVVEVVRALQARSGDSARIELAPWTRGYNQAKSLANVGLFATVRGAAREALFQWVGPLVQSRTCFYSHQDSPLRINSLADAARDGRLAVPRQWYSHEYLSSQGLNNIFTVTSPEKMMTMFQNRRINLLVASDVSLPQMLTQQGMQVNAVKRQLCFMQNQSYLAFSLQTDETIVRRWQDSLQAMRADGSFARIHQRWFPGRPLPDAVPVETVPVADR